MRAYIRKHLPDACIDRVEITRSRGSVRVLIATARPGLVIGRRGAQIRELEKALRNIYTAIQRKYKPNAKPTGFQFKIDIQEIKEGEAYAQVLAEEIVGQLERRMRSRRVLRQMLDKARRNPKVKGVKIRLAGRLNGAEIARQEWVSDGRIPLQTLRANIQYGEATAYSPYGAIGVKVFIYLGEVFEEDADAADKPANLQPSFRRYPRYRK